MKIRIEVTSWFKRYVNGQEVLEIDVADGATAVDVICSIGIPKDEIGFITLKTKIDGNERNMAKKDFTLNEVDIIKVYPYIIGG